MTERLYYGDPYLREFSAKVVRRLSHDGKPALILDRTAFYPTSGGQPNDRGTLGSARVVDVIEQGEEIVHVLDVDPAGAELRGAIDWDRRRDHMQHHHGQHLLSAAFERTARAETSSFHLGEETCTIELDKVVSAADAEAAEELANRVIWENRPVTIGLFSREQVAKLPLRKPPDVPGPIRLIEVKDFDLCPCCGTHPRSTGEVGAVLVLGVEKGKGTSRVSFVCGWRALALARRNEATLRALGAKLSAGRDGLEKAVERIQAEGSEARKSLKAAERRLATVDAAELLAAASPKGAVRMVVKRIDGRDLESLRSLATEIVAKPGAVAILGSGGSQSSIVLARSKEIELDLRPIGQEALAAIGGKGGGPPHFVQGGGPGADLKAAMELAESKISSALQR